MKNRGTEGSSERHIQINRLNLIELEPRRHDLINSIAKRKLREEFAKKLFFFLDMIAAVSE